MPSEIMEKRPLSSFYMAPAPSSFFSNEIHLPTERQVGFWKPDSATDFLGTEGVPLMLGSKSMAQSREEFSHSLSSIENPHLIKDSKSKFSFDHHSPMARTSMVPWRTTEQDLGPQRSMHGQPTSLYMDGNKNGFQYENGLFSCSFSELLSRKLRISSDAFFEQSTNSFNTHLTSSVNTKFKEDEPLELSEEIEAQTIGDLLPGDEELLSGVIDDLECITRTNNSDDVEEDLFYSGGGLELEADGNLNNKNSDIANGVSNSQGVLGVPFAGEHPYGEHPSRTLFVRNINSNVEDSELKTLFEQYGDIRNIYTACKHRGFVMISYYDIRSARNAMRALQNKPLRRRKLDIHFSIPKDNPSEKDMNQGTLVVFNLDSSVSNDDLRQIFGLYGEIKEIRETPHKHNHKFIEFYDVRAAEAALRALNRSDIAGKRIKLEPSRPGGARRSSVQQFSPDLETEESNGSHQQGSPVNNSPPGGYGSISAGTITSDGLDGECFIGVQSQMDPFVENKFPEISPTISHALPSPIRAASLGNHTSQPGLLEHSHSLGQIKFGFPSIHSVTDYHDGLSNNSTFNSTSIMPSVAININSRPTDTMDNRHVHRVGSGGPNSQSYGPNESAFGTSGNASCPLHGHQYVWNNSNSYHHHHSPGNSMWQNSPTLVNNILNPPSQLQGLSRAQSHLLSSVLPLHHHVGSAPSVNPSLWDRRHTYSGDANDASGFRPGSLGSMGFPGSPTLHALGLASHNIFPHIGGNCMEPSLSSPHLGLHSPQQRCHMFHGRNSMIPMPATLDVPHDRVRSRRNEANSNQADNKKQYELDIERIIRGDDSRTTLMIKNIPNKYTSKMLLAAIDENHRGTYDFIYLPIDFKNKCNVGYAFINMTDPQQIIPFFKTFNGKKWEKFNSEKVASLAYARIQGKAALIAHFQNSSLMNEDKRCRPILFHTDGPNAGDQEPFPMGINVRSRPGRARATAIEDNNQESTSTALSGEETSNALQTPLGPGKDSE